jgi:hypothetical protein
VPIRDLPGFDSIPRKPFMEQATLPSIKERK